MQIKAEGPHELQLISGFLGSEAAAAQRVREWMLAMEDEVAEDRWEESKAQEAVEQSEFSVPQSIYLSWIRRRVAKSASLS